MKLSICIPTYKRVAFLSEVINSVISEAKNMEDIEIVISDNASGDGTRELIKEWQGRSPIRIVYHEWVENAGADKNFLKVVEIASGDYCWLMGSDDGIESGGLDRVLDGLGAHPGVPGISVNVAAYDYKLRNRIHTRPVASGVLGDGCYLVGDVEITKYLGDYWGYLSGQIINRGAWKHILQESNIEKYFNAYIHIYVIGRMVQRDPRWLYVGIPSVKWRSGNDSFLQEGGALKRLRIDSDGYPRIFGDIWGTESVIYKNVINVVTGVHIKYAVLGAKLNNFPVGYYLDVIKVTWPKLKTIRSYWTKVLPLLILPSFLLIGVRYVYRRTLKRWRHRRLNVDCISGC